MDDVICQESERDPQGEVYERRQDVRVFRCLWYVPKHVAGGDCAIPNEQDAK